MVASSCYISSQQHIFIIVLDAALVLDLLECDHN
jgi:hypothetical protein